MQYRKMMLTPYATIFFSSFLIALSGALMPGPLLSVTIAESARRGTLTGPTVILGHGLLEIGLVLALLSGLAPLFLREDVFILICFTGGLILLWMAFSMIKSLPKLSLRMERTEAERPRNLVAAGALLSATNPYFILWWASVGFGYILYSAKFGMAGILCFLSGHLAADLGWYALVSWGMSRGQHLLSDRIYRRICGGCALFLVVFAGYFFYSGTHKLFI